MIDLLRHRVGLAALAACVASACVSGCGGEVEDPASQRSEGSPSGGQGGEGGEAGPEPTLDDAPVCDSTESRIEVNAGGDDFEVSITTSAIGAPHDSLYLMFEEYGLLLVRASQYLEENVPHPVTGMLRLPENGADPGAWYCAGEGSAITFDWYMKSRVMLRSVSRLGSCPGEPVDGEITYQADSGGVPVKSTVSSATFDFHTRGGLARGHQTGMGDTSYSSASDGLGFFVVQADLDRSGAVPVGVGFLVVPDGYPDAGAVYCAGEGSTVRYAPGPYADIASAVFRNVSRLGSCSEQSGTGEIGICTDAPED